jgi:hypothetical protein
MGAEASLEICPVHDRFKYHSLVSVAEDAMLQMPAHAVESTKLLEIASFADQVFKSIAMGDAATSCSIIGPSSRNSVT